MTATDLLRPAMAVAAGCYRAAVRARRLAYDRKWIRAEELPVPVISVGNLSAGGTGKSPCVAAVVRLLVREGFRPAVVSRGYKGRRKGLVVVSDGDRRLADPPEVADEAAMLADQLPGVPVLTGAHRPRVGRAAIEAFGADVIVLDDGFQHRGCARDLDVVLVDATHPPGADALLPMGRLREPPSSLARADLVVATKSTRHEDTIAVGQWVWGRLPIVRAQHVPVGWRVLRDGARVPLSDRPEGPAVAFCGLAAPESFRSTLAGLGVPVVGFTAYRDHHVYRASDGVFLATWARRLGARWFVTTEKDAVRLGGLGVLPYPICALAIEFNLVEGAQLWEEAILAAARGGRA
ncbi:MAG: tetraacyldisaccharide 4'-kinase [bacterium]